MGFAPLRLPVANTVRGLPEISLASATRHNKVHGKEGASWAQTG
jgi:hypothetical protein